MSLPDDLLDLAGRLARLDPTRPKQASLRRAISTAYYALFHLLTAEAARLFAAEPGLAAAVGRSLNHGEMKASSPRFAGGALPQSLAAHAGGLFATPDGDGVKEVARAFVELQEARHEADYDTAKRYTRNNALLRVARAEQAFAVWADIRRSDLARLYVGCLLLWDRWNKPAR